MPFTILQCVNKYIKKKKIIVHQVHVSPKVNGNCSSIVWLLYSE